MSDSTDLLNALYVSTTSQLLTRIGSTEQYASDQDFFKTWEGKLFVSPRTKDGITFVFGVDHEATADSWMACRLRPTVTLVKDLTAIHCWAFETPVRDEDAQPLATALGMETVDEMIPLPPTNGWILLQHDPSRYYALGDLCGAYLTNSTESTTQTYNDATCLTPYDPDDERYKQPIVISVGANKESANWRPDDKTPDVATLFLRLSEHREGKKDGLSFVTGDMVKGRRLKTAIKALYCAGLDIDNGTSSAQIDKSLIELGCAAIRYTTHSHFKTRTEFKKDAITKFAPDEDIDDEVIQRYLREKEQWDKHIVESAHYLSTDHTERGIMITVDHAPMPKHRIVIPFAHPFVIADEGATQQAAMERWTKVPLALAEKLGIPLDKTGTDPSRLFYFPRHAANRPYEITITGGDLFDWKSLELDNPYEQIAKEVSKGTGKSKTPEGKDLGRWSMKAAHGFQIVDLIEAHAPDKIRGKASSGVDIECPFDEEHSNPGDPDDRACFIVNAGEGSTDWFTASCRHDSCRDYTNLDMVGRMVKDGWFPREALDDDNFNAAIVEDAPNPVAAKRIEKEDKAKAKYQQALDALTGDSADTEIDAAIVLCIEAGLNLRSMEMAQKQVSKITDTGISVVRKMFKRVASDLKQSDDNRKSDEHGLDLFTFNTEFNFDDASKKCFRALKHVNEKERLPVFCHISGALVRLNRTDKSGRLSFDELNAMSLWSELNKRIAFVRKSDGAESTRQKVPEDVARQCFEQGYEELPAAPEVIYTPLYTGDGSLMVTPGWWPAHDILMANTGFRVDEIAPEPTVEEVEEAVLWLRTEVFGDFPFLDYDLTGKERREPSEANAFAMLLTPFMRRMITSCTPVFFINKPTPGTGGTLLGKIPMILFDGFESAPMRYTQSEEEMQKAITAAIMETRSHLFFDDVREFNNRQLLQSITAKEIGGRVLGMSKNITRPNLFGWIATANNADVRGEMERRVCWIRMNAKTPDIQKRKFRHSNFDQFLMENRAVAVKHILTMIEYWLSVGAPRFTDRKRASFEDWSEKVGGVLMVCGVTGFLDNRRVLAQDLEEAAVKSFVRDWLRKYQVDRYVLPTELFSWAKDAEMDICTGQNEDQARSRFMRMLPTLDGRVFHMEGGEFMVRSGQDSDENLAYAIVRVETPPPAELDPIPHVIEPEAA